MFCDGRLLGAGAALGVGVAPLALLLARDAATLQLQGSEIVRWALFSFESYDFSGAMFDFSLRWLADDAFQWVFNLNILGTILPTQVFGKVMAQQGEGVIINISSMNSFRPLTRIVAYSAAKAAVNNFTQWMAVHFNQNYSKSIRVNAIAPAQITNEGLEKRMQADPGLKAMFLHGIPMGRLGRPDEIKGIVIFLASDASSQESLAASSFRSRRRRRVYETASLRAIR